MCMTLDNILLTLDNILLSEIKTDQEQIRVLLLTGVTRVGKLPETKSRVEVTGAGAAVGTEILLGKMKNSGDGWWGWQEGQ